MLMNPLTINLTPDDSRRLVTACANLGRSPFEIISDALQYYIGEADIRIEQERKQLVDAHTEELMSIPNPIKGDFLGDCTEIWEAADKRRQSLDAHTDKTISARFDRSHIRVLRHPNAGVNAPLWAVIDGWINIQYNLGTTYAQPDIHMPDRIAYVVAANNVSDVNRMIMELDGGYPHRTTHQLTPERMKRWKVRIKQT